MFRGFKYTALHIGLTRNASYSNRTGSFNTSDVFVSVRSSSVALKIMHL